MTMPGGDTSWGGLLNTALNIGASIYTGQLQKKAMKAAIKAGTSDFPQLGLGLAASGPQRGVMQPLQNAGYLNIGPNGIQLGDGSAPGGSMDSSMMPRGPQYAIGQTASGRQKLLAIRSIGTPLLWSGDLAAVRRVARVARKLGRFVHHRRPR